MKCTKLVIILFIACIAFLSRVYLGYAEISFCDSNPWDCKAYFGTETFSINKIALSQPLPLCIIMTYNGTDYTEEFPSIFLDRYMKFDSSNMPVASSLAFDSNNVNNPFKINFGNVITAKYVTNSPDANIYTRLIKLDNSQRIGMKQGYFIVSSINYNKLIIRASPFESDVFNTNYGLDPATSLNTKKFVIVIPNLFAGTTGIPKTYYDSTSNLIKPIIDIDQFVNPYLSNDIDNYPQANLKMGIKIQIPGNAIPVIIPLNINILPYSDVPLGTLNLSTSDNPN